MKQTLRVVLYLLLTLQVLPIKSNCQPLKQVTAEINKKLITDFYNEVWGKGNLDFADKVFNEYYIRHDLRPGNALPGPEGQKKIAGDFRKAFPDLTIQIDLIVAADDFVTARWTMSGTHTGKWGTIEPTNKKATFSGVNIFRMENGKVKEIWNHRDDFGLFEQLGVKVYAGSKQ
jgi:predicted ester cyclase